MKLALGNRRVGNEKWGHAANDEAGCWGGQEREMESGRLVWCWASMAGGKGMIDANWVSQVKGRGGENVSH